MGIDITAHAKHSQGSPVDKLCRYIKSTKEKGCNQGIHNKAHITNQTAWIKGSWTYNIWTCTIGTKLEFAQREIYRPLMRKMYNLWPRNRKSLMLMRNSVLLLRAQQLVHKCSSASDTGNRKIISCNLADLKARISKMQTAFSTLSKKPEEIHLYHNSKTSKVNLKRSGYHEYQWRWWSRRY